MGDSREATDVLLVGGGVASARCARTLRRSGFEGSVLLVGEEALPPYNRPPLSKELLRDDAPDELLLAEPARWYERHGVELATGVRVVRLEPDGRRAALSDGRSISFGRCLLATGAAPRPLPVTGGESALLLRTLGDARALRAAALEALGQPGVVVGGGLIGVEVASGLAALGVRPTVVERTGALWAGALGELLSAWALDRLAAAGVEVRLNATVTELDGGRVRLGGEALPAAFVVAGVGVSPRDGLAGEAGIAVDRGIVVKVDQRTSHDAVWAAGDATRLDRQGSEHWHAAREAGERAALSMLGMDVPAPRPAWIFTEVTGTAVDVFGDGEGVDEERWIVSGSVIARGRAGRLSQLVVIGSAIPAEAARSLVERGADDAEILAATAARTPPSDRSNRGPEV